MPRWPDTREPHERFGLCCGCGVETVLVRVATHRYRCPDVCAPKEQRGEATTWIPGTPRRALLSR